MATTLFRTVVLLTMLLPLQSCGMVYKAEPIEAWVVDAESGKALEGVIVTANWRLMGGLEGGNELGQMMVMETVTDKDGRFYFRRGGRNEMSLTDTSKVTGRNFYYLRAVIVFGALQQNQCN